MEKAACKGKAPVRQGADAEKRDPWFPDRGGKYLDAMEACFMCNVRLECESYRQAIQPAYGVWAGRIQKRGKANKELHDDREAV